MEARPKLGLLRLGQSDELDGRLGTAGSHDGPDDPVDELARRRVPGGWYGTDHLGPAASRHRTERSRPRSPRLWNRPRVDDGANGLLEAIGGTVICAARSRVMAWLSFDPAVVSQPSRGSHRYDNGRG